MNTSAQFHAAIRDHLPHANATSQGYGDDGSKATNGAQMSFHSLIFPY